MLLGIPQLQFCNFFEIRHVRDESDRRTIHRNSVTRSVQKFRGHPRKSLKKTRRIARGSAQTIGIKATECLGNFLRSRVEKSRGPPQPARLFIKPARERTIFVRLLLRGSPVESGRTIAGAKGHRYFQRLLSPPAKGVGTRKEISEWRNRTRKKANRRTKCS